MHSRPRSRLSPDCYRTESVNIHRSYFATTHSIIFSVYRRDTGELNIPARNHTIGGRARDVIHHDTQGDNRHTIPQIAALNRWCTRRNSTASKYTFRSHASSFSPLAPCFQCPNTKRLTRETRRYACCLHVALFGPGRLDQFTQVRDVNPAYRGLALWELPCSVFR
jgi:hypothetical protein